MCQGSLVLQFLYAEVMDRATARWRQRSMHASLLGQRAHVQESIPSLLVSRALSSKRTSMAVRVHGYWAHREVRPPLAIPASRKFSASLAVENMVWQRNSPVRLSNCEKAL